METQMRVLLSEPLQPEPPGPHVPPEMPGSGDPPDIPLTEFPDPREAPDALD
jgi:hypothetical protein